MLQWHVLFSCTVAAPRHAQGGANTTAQVSDVQPFANVKECFIVNKTQLVSFFVYRRKSRDRFRIVFRYIDSMLFVIQFQGYTLVSIFMAITCFCFRRWSIQGEGRVFMM